MKRTYLFSMLSVVLIFFTQSLQSSEQEKFYFETVSKLFKPHQSEKLNCVEEIKGESQQVHEKPYKMSNEIREKYAEKIKRLLLESREFVRWSLQKCDLPLFQDKKISEQERQTFEKVQKCSVRICGRVLDALEKIDCFVPVSQKTYSCFPGAQWSPQKVKNRSKVPLKKLTNNEMKFYHIGKKYYMVLYQHNIDMCDRFLGAIYGQKFDGLEKEESEYVENSFTFIQKQVEDIMELLGPDKKLVISEDTSFDLSTIQELLK